MINKIYNNNNEGVSEGYIGFYLTSTVELIGENGERLKVVNCLHKKSFITDVWQDLKSFMTEVPII